MSNCNCSGGCKPPTSLGATNTLYCKGEVVTVPYRSEIFSQRFKEAIPDLMQDIEEYIQGTFAQHYMNEDQLQTIDAWNASGSFVTTSRDMARKYLDRYGKKDGNNPKDLLKIFHFVLMMYFKNHVDQ